MALRNLGIEHEVVAISEIDKFAIKSYEAIYGKTRNDVPNRPDNIWIEKDGKPYRSPYKRIIIRRRKI